MGALGAFADFFAVKEEIFRGSNMDLIDQCCAELKAAGRFYQRIKINQETPKCDGNCAGCAAMEQVDENTPMYKKIGIGCSSDLLTSREPYDIFAIYVKKSEEEQCRKIIAPLTGEMA